MASLGTLVATCPSCAGSIAFDVLSTSPSKQPPNDEGTYTVQLDVRVSTWSKRRHAACFPDGDGGEHLPVAV